MSLKESEETKIFFCQFKHTSPKVRTGEAKKILYRLCYGRFLLKFIGGKEQVNCDISQT